MFAVLGKFDVVHALMHDPYPPPTYLRWFGGLHSDTSRIGEARTTVHVHGYLVVAISAIDEYESHIAVAMFYSIRNSLPDGRFDIIQVLAGKPRCSKRHDGAASLSCGRSLMWEADTNLRHFNAASRKRIPTYRI